MSIVSVLISLVVAFAVQLFPVFTSKQQLDIFATEIVREAEIKGSTSVDSRIADMREQTGLDPDIRWDCFVPVPMLPALLLPTL